MGVGGGSQIIEFLPNGVYNGDCLNSTNLYVDGELVRYKGQYESNMVARCPEEAIAQSSFLYLQKRVMMLVNYLGKTFNNVYVFMDGKRVENKIERVYNSGFNNYDIRNFFKRICSDNNYRVVQLETGESELQMYIQRDRHASLNVFLTRDSDMLSILYSHKPSIVYKCNVTEKCTNFTMKKHHKSRDSVMDNNEFYNDGNWIVTDSCVWAICDIQKTIGSNNISIPITMIGFDFMEQRVGLHVLVWRSYCVLCGTDFTPPLFTSTMRKSALKNLTSKEFQILNTLANETFNSTTGTFSRNVIMKIVVTLLIAAIRCGSLKKKTQSIKIGFTEYNKCIDLYYDAICTYFVYIDTGTMPSLDIQKLTDPYNCIVNIIHACRNGQIMDMKHYKQWAANVGIEECFENIANYKPDPPKCRKRKIENVESKIITNDEVVESNRKFMLFKYQNDVLKYVSGNRELLYLVRDFF